MNFSGIESHSRTRASSQSTLTRMAGWLMVRAT
uniref:Uncharacterized protein n=1 Tax=Human herpesvirus 2 TaxID=10310 RepID=A0A481TBF4_HHV2|nr:hypothetical protein [Human alphaherpesvirus 2]